jgi:thiamine pyrophosphate-dependent acetolactate synthase large subunit-like protein
LNYTQGERAYGRGVRDTSELRGALREALDANVPAVVEVMIDKEAIAPVTMYEAVLPKTL